MCLTVYVAADKPLKEISFDRNVPKFYIRELEVSEMFVRKHFSLEHVVYAGSSEGCGCGFRHALLDKPGKWLDVIKEENMQEQEDMNNLHAYLSDAISWGCKIELFVCWNGDGFNVQNKITIPVSELADPKFYLKENSFYEVY